MEDESYVDFIMPVMDSMVGTGSITQVLLRANLERLRKALTAPLTSFIYITMRPRHDREYELDPLIEKCRAELETIPGCIASCWGPSLHHDGIEIGVIGWQSMTVRILPLDHFEGSLKHLLYLV